MQYVIVWLIDFYFILLSYLLTYLLLLLLIIIQTCIRCSLSTLEAECEAQVSLCTQSVCTSTRRWIFCSITVPRWTWPTSEACLRSRRASFTPSSRGRAVTAWASYVASPLPEQFSSREQQSASKKNCNICLIFEGFAQLLIVWGGVRAIYGLPVPLISWHCSFWFCFTCVDFIICCWILINLIWFDTLSLSLTAIFQVNLG